ncbi:FecR family protein [Chitinophaga ginsengisoli]|uniref:FecR family protein n=1 Tax=Chitinophaga ginsengisoli TaxID=363837 RepID=A0A2P8GKQ8_9BACT|nr:FecR family protein [Chitinophaga ginsengisoli]PSL34542.1 FecR family protein [Chitinophaga ginsengisoli]
MRPDKALIEKFNNGDCTPEEVKVVMNWLLENEADNEAEAEWERVSWKGTYPEAYDEEMLSHIQANTFGEKTLIRRLPWRGLAVAASVLLITGLFLWQHLLPGSGRKATGIALQQEAHQQDTSWLVYNAVTQPAYFRLPDGSVARLFPGTEIRFDSSAYNVNSRTIYLKGTAEFDVAAVAGKPFSVAAGGFTTTALGTRFMMAAGKGKQLLVRLYSGKVVVKKTDNQLYAMNDVYLAPGDEWQYYRDTHQHLLSHAWQQRIATQNDIRLSTIQVNDNNIVFENTPLKEVFDFLQEQYHVTINYQQKDFKDVYFSGKILPGDSLKMVLGNIARINELTLTADEGVFIIR